MILPSILLYAISLLYLTLAERFRTFASIMALQGWLLFAIALVRLHGNGWGELVFVAAETLVFKALLVPALLFAVIRKTGIGRIEACGTSQAHALLLSVGALAVSASIAYCLADSAVDPLFFGVSLYALSSGLVLIVLRTRIFAHMVGFLTIENGVFLFSTAIGVRMPLAVGVAVLLDILMSVLMLGIFFMRLDGTLHGADADALTRVKD